MHVTLITGDKYAMKHLTVVLDQTEGALAKVSQTLGNANINITAIDAEEIDKQGVMHIGVDDEQLQPAYEVLREAGFQVMPQTVLLVRVEDKPGGLAKLAVLLAEAKVNVRSMRIVKREDGSSLCAIVPEPFDIAKAVLADKVVAA